MTKYDEEINELLKKKSKLLKDPRRSAEFFEVSSRLGYLYYQKGYYEKAVEEYDEGLSKRETDKVDLDSANIHRFIGEALCRIGEDFKRAKQEFDIYHAITIKLKDLVEIQRSYITLGNYYMTFIDDKKENRIENLNKAYSHYLKAYDILDDIEEKNLVDNRELALMKTRICFNCANALDEKKDDVMSNEYLKTAINLAETNNFYEDLIRCLYIKCDRAKLTKNFSECLKIADKIVDITLKIKDFVQQSNDLLYVAELYINESNYEKAKGLLKKAYKLRRKCLISPTIKTKLKNVLKVIKLTKQIASLEQNHGHNLAKLSKLYEELSDSYCALGNFNYGLNGYKKQLHYATLLHVAKQDLALIYASIAQTYQDLEDYSNSLRYYELELDNCDEKNYESACKSLLNIAVIKENMKHPYEEIKSVYDSAFNKAVALDDSKLQLKVLVLLEDLQKLYDIEDDVQTKNKIKEIKAKLSDRGINDEDDDESSKSSENQENSSDESIMFSSESEEEEEIVKTKSNNNRNVSKILKRNIRGETALHVACIKGNLEMVQKLLSENHPVHVRDNFLWTPLHEACNYGYVEIVKLLLKNGAKYNDQDGPITPLHDSAQNGHFQVVEALLEAGASSYVFTDDGYTPLDFLCKYKRENESDLTDKDLALFKKLYDIMLKQIQLKDPKYGIKDIMSTNPCVACDDESNSNDAPKRPIKINITDDNDTQEVKKVNSVHEYKSAIMNVGRKNKSGFSNTSKQSPKKKLIDRVIVTEDEYKIGDKWLIDDLVSNDKTHKNTKRKTATYTDDEHDSSTSTEKLEKSPKSKKRLISIENNYESEQSSSNSKKYDNFADLIDTEEELDFLAAHLSKKTSIGSNQSSNFDFDKRTSTQNENNSSSSIEIISLKSPAKSIKPLSFQQPSSKVAKKQLKINKMDTFGLKQSKKQHSFNSDTHDNSIELLNDSGSKHYEPQRLSNSSVDNSTLSDKSSSSSSKTNWKIKINIENRNLLIPITNLNDSIDDLNKQILSRYKSLFSDEMDYREPLKVILKNNDGFILFGKDLIKDVLNDSCQVQAEVESWKDAPKIHELYEKACERQSKIFYKVIQSKLRDSETSQQLNLSNFNLSHINNVFDIIKLNNNYLNTLVAIDLSSNSLNDEFSLNFFDCFEKMSFLKHFNVSYNQLTVKSLKYFCQILSKTNKPLAIEYLNFSGNDFSDTDNNILSLTTTLLTKLNLKSFEVSDCNIDMTNEVDASTLNDFSNAVKNSNLTHLNVSYNKINHQVISCILDGLSNDTSHEMVEINLANCIRVTTKCVMDAFLKFINHNQNRLEVFNISHFNMDYEQSDVLLTYLCNCRCLKQLDISYNMIKLDSVISILNRCSSLEKLSIINLDKTFFPNSSNFFAALTSKIASYVPLKSLTFKFFLIDEFYKIKEIFQNKWANNLRLAFRTSTIVEISY